MKELKNKKVIVALSGGVDSALAAALLKRAGFYVEGVFMKLWPARVSAGEKRAKLVAKKLRIPLRVLNFEREFKRKVFQYFLDEYRAGRTPNPCVVCNKEIKFGLLLGKAPAMKADFIATGHYAITKQGKLFQGEDKEKDQSYFLWQLGQKQLSRVLFPLGNYTKPEVRMMAKKFGLPAFNAPESQEICFVQGSLNNFLAKYIKPRPGKIIDSRGKVLGKHKGLIFYTLGQRKGIGLSGGPYWVLAKDLKKNILVVTKKEKDLFKKELFYQRPNWVPGKAPKFPLEVKAKIRYRSPLAGAKLFKGRVVFKKPQRAITPGQSVVFYKGRELIGGGIITHAR